MSSTQFVGLVVVLGSCLLAVDASGQYNRTPYPPQPQPLASRAAMEKVNKARAEVTKFQAVSNQAAAKVRQQFETGSEWQAASAAQKQAQAESEGARKRVLDVVHETAAYKQAQATKNSLESDLTQAKEGGDSAAITTAARQIMEAGAVLSKMDGDALAADAKFVESKKTLLDANTKVAALAKQCDDLVKADPAWQATRKDVATAEAAKAQADKEMVAAQKTDSDAMANWRRQCAQVDQQNRDQAAREAMQRQQNYNNNRRF